MATQDLGQECKDYLSRNNKPPITSKIKHTFTRYMPFGNGYSQVPTEDDATSTASASTSSSWFKSQSEEESWISLTRFQRIVAFSICLGLGLLFFTLSALYAPFLLLKARKFSLLFTLGSLFIIFSFSFLLGPMNHLKHLFSRERLVFTSSYFGTLFATLYFAMAIQSTPLTVIFAVLQVIALLWFLISYIPGGTSGLRFFTQMCASSVKSSVSRTLPV